MLRTVRTIVRNSTAATAIEYALIASLIAVAIVTNVGNLGAEVGAVFLKATTRLAAASA